MCARTQWPDSPMGRTLNNRRWWENQIRAESPGFVSALGGVILQRKASTLTRSLGPECWRYLLKTDYPRIRLQSIPCWLRTVVSAHALNSSAQTNTDALCGLIFPLDCPLARTLLNCVGSSFFTPDLYYFIQAVREVPTSSDSFYYAVRPRKIRITFLLLCRRGFG